MARLLRLNADDNVAIAREDLAAGAAVDGIEIRDAVPRGHKVALDNVVAGAAVVKFGVAIGTATRPIGVGEHVHVHNLESERMRGDRG